MCKDNYTKERGNNSKKLNKRLVKVKTFRYNSSYNLLD